MNTIARLTMSLMLMSGAAYGQRQSTVDPSERNTLDTRIATSALDENATGTNDARNGPCSGICQNPSDAGRIFTTLYRFDNDGGHDLYANLTQATDGNFYGTTVAGGAGLSAAGTVFKITPDGTLTTLYIFCSRKVGNRCTDGVTPEAALIQAADGNLYGTTLYGGAYGKGSIFKITLAGMLTTVHSFCADRVGGDCTDGFRVPGGLVQSTDGSFYGMTFGDGTHHGTVFRLDPDGTLATLYRFCADANCTEGANPRGSLVQGVDGNLYGTTSSGAANGLGAVFKITPSGTLTTLYPFCSETNCADGWNPTGTLTQGRDGSFYGTTNSGGLHGSGTVFQITPEGNLTTLYNFCSEIKCPDGAHPLAGLVQASNGAFYGTTETGGAYGEGSIFEITPGGVLTTLHSVHAKEGTHPFAGLLQSTDGIFFGTTNSGGTFGMCHRGCGTVFSISVGLGSFVETQTSSGPVGSTVVILGNNLTGSTRVAFNKTAAIFSVVSESEITATVPGGATTGYLKVTSSTGKVLKSNNEFIVVP